MKLATAPQDVSIPEVFEQRDVAIGDVAFILDMFSDKVYTNKVRAVIRELACNAHDSHIIAGTTDIPFEVHLPTHLEPWFAIRDYGTGLCDEDIANVYGAIGVSTKRDSNEVIGCFGIGSLSPYSMCDSFIVKSCLDGIVRTYQCMRDEQRQPKVIPLGAESTDEANGLEINLTVDGKVEEFHREACEVFAFWEGTLPQINDELVISKSQQLRDSYIFKGDDFGLTSSWGNMYALMGNISYKIPSDWDSFNVDGYVKFELGELEFDTARENLSVTDANRDVVKSKFAKVKNSLKDIAIERIEAMPTAFEKAKLAEKLNRGRIGNYIGSRDLAKYALPEPSEKIVYWVSKYRGSDKGTTKFVDKFKDVSYYLHKDRMTTRIKSHLRDMSSGYTMYIFKDLAQVKECGIPVELLEDLDDLPKIVRSSYGGTYSSCKTLLFNSSNSWGYKDADYWDEKEIELDGSEIVYVEVNRNKPVASRRLGYLRYTEDNRQVKSTLKTAKEHIGEINLIGLKTAFLKTAAFRKGNFIHLDDYLKREYTKIAPKTFFEYDDGDLGTFKTINKHIDNDEVREIVELAESCKNNGIAVVCDDLGITVEITKDTMLQEMMDEWNDRYKMLNLVSDWEIKQNKEIIAEYIGGSVK